ncbi:MAG: hypothetical protein UY42_C0011G0016 [Parcubacteria group bacterium GW2011_GWA2_49_16]|nr:MAG: hypothetical protein UY42_C0011G0016 [Parcubacteria group bacterium GW2011_GWA2_49_16]
MPNKTVETKERPWWKRSAIFVLLVLVAVMWSYVITLQKERDEFRKEADTAKEEVKQKAKEKKTAEGQVSMERLAAKKARDAEVKARKAEADARKALLAAEGNKNKLLAQKKMEKPVTKTAPPPPIDETKNQAQVIPPSNTWPKDCTPAFDSRGNPYCLEAAPVAPKGQVAQAEAQAEVASSSAPTTTVHCPKGVPILASNGSVWCEESNDRFSGAWIGRRGVDVAAGCLVGLVFGHGHGCGQAAAWALGAGWAGEEVAGETGRWVGVLGAGAIVGGAARPGSAAAAAPPAAQGGRVRPLPFPAQ